MENNKENQRITITVDNESISQPFTGKDDVEYVQIICPSESSLAKRSFVLPATYIRESKFNENQSFFSFPKDYIINLRKSVKIGEEDGNPVFDYEQSQVSPSELKSVFAKSLKKETKESESQEVNNQQSEPSM